MAGTAAGKKTAHAPLPQIPDKLYFRIGEAARLLDVAPYVLRFWESEFPQLKPNKGGTGQRLYRRRDVEMALRIRRLLYDEGYTIPGARQLLKGEVRGTKEAQLSLRNESVEVQKAAQLRKMRTELKELSALLERPLPGNRRVGAAPSNVVRLNSGRRAPARSDAKQAGPTLFPES